MTKAQHVFAVLVSLASLAVIVELVRRRKLKEEYSLLWILTAAGMLAMWPNLVGDLIGVALAVLTLGLPRMLRGAVLEPRIAVEAGAAAPAERKKG